MKILIEHGGHRFSNMGDLAMLQITIERLKKLWPNAHINVIASNPEDLIHFCPDAHPIDAYGSHIWFYPLSKKLQDLVPASLAQSIEQFEWELRHQSPNLMKRLIHNKPSVKGQKSKHLNSFIEAIETADLIVCSGGGYISDSFRPKVSLSMGILGLAAKLSKPTAMFGQGFGPLHEPDLFKKVKAVLPSVDMISLREKRSNLTLMNDLNVSPEKLIVTGDDAIEVAYRVHKNNIGHSIGVNLRIADYSNVNVRFIAVLKSTLQEFALKKKADLLPVPIEFFDESSDTKTIQKLLEGYNNHSDGGQSLDAPEKIASQISNCRVVVTGSYHAGVFALAQGIPVVALVKSLYYKDKFLGLADQFGTGCKVVFLDDSQFQNSLANAINEAWDSAEELRPKLLDRAKQQIDASYHAYQKFYQFVENR